MTHRNRRFNLALFIFCILVAAAVTAPGWIRSRTQQTPVIIQAESTAAEAREMTAPPLPASMTMASDAFTLAGPVFANAADDTPEVEAATLIQPDEEVATDAAQGAPGIDATHDTHEQAMQHAALNRAGMHALKGGGRTGSRDAQPTRPGETPGAIDTPNENEPSEEPGGPDGPVDPAPVDPRPVTPRPPEPPGKQPISVPEPSTLGLLVLGLAGIAGTRRRRATQRD